MTTGDPRFAFKAARAHAPKDWRVCAWCAVFVPIIGLLAIVFAQLLANPGNRKSTAQAGFENDIAPRLAAVPLLLRFVIILGPSV